MTAELVLEYIPRRMRELGYGKDYYLRLRHLVLRPNEHIEIEAWSDLFILVEEVSDVRISSDTGVFDLGTEAASEMQYEHQGLIEITNGSDAVTKHVKLVQIIPHKSE